MSDGIKLFCFGFESACIERGPCELQVVKACGMSDWIELFCFDFEFA